MRGVRQRVRQQAGRVRRRVARGAVMALGTTALVAALSSPAAGASDTVVATGLIDDQAVGREIGDPDNGDGGGEGAGHFVDDDGSDYESALDALDAAGVFVDTKCGVDRICPDETVRRWVAAVWLGRVLPDITPEASAPSPFEDVDVAEWWLHYAIHLASLDILPGCQGSDESEGGVADNYCPDDDITRSQVASALAAAFELEPSGRAGLTDISDRGDADDIDAVVERGHRRGLRHRPAALLPGRHHQPRGDGHVPGPGSRTGAAVAVGSLQLSGSRRRACLRPARRQSFVRGTRRHRDLLGLWRRWSDQLGVTVRGYRIAVVSDDGDTHTVTISRRPEE